MAGQKSPGFVHVLASEHLELAQNSVHFLLREAQNGLGDPVHAAVVVALVLPPVTLSHVLAATSRVLLCQVGQLVHAVPAHVKTEFAGRSTRACAEARRGELERREQQTKTNPKNKLGVVNWVGEYFDTHTLRTPHLWTTHIHTFNSPGQALEVTIVAVVDSKGPTVELHPVQISNGRKRVVRVSKLHKGKASRFTLMVHHELYRGYGTDLLEGFVQVLRSAREDGRNERR